MGRDEKLKLIWRHTHKDYRGRIGGCGAILILRQGVTCLVSMLALTDEEIAARLPYAVRKEAERKAGHHAP